MADKPAQERTELATPKRLREAREKGQIPRSRELNTMTLLMASAGGLLILGGGMVTDLQELMRNGLAIEPARSMNTHSVIESFSSIALQGLTIFAPLFLLLLVVAFLTPVGLGGFSFSVKAMSFKWEKLDPIKGLGRIFALRGLMEMLKVLAKFGLVAAVSGLILWSLIDELLGLGDEPLQHMSRNCAAGLSWPVAARSF